MPYSRKSYAARTPQSCMCFRRDKMFTLRGSAIVPARRFPLREYRVLVDLDLDQHNRPMRRWVITEVQFQWYAELLVPRTHNKFGDRSFSAAGPRLWNDLPPGLRRPDLTFDFIRESLKSYLFGDWSAKFMTIVFISAIQINLSI